MRRVTQCGTFPLKSQDGDEVFLDNAFALNEGYPKIISD
jgi:hypothetical protein